MSTVRSLLFDDQFSLPALVFFMLWMLVVGIGWGGDLKRDEERQEAIKAGVGQYTTNPKTGETTFVYGVVKQ